VHIVLVGLNHETTPVELREKLAFQSNHLGQALAQLTQPEGDSEAQISEAVILSTCNRVEIYALVESIEAGNKKIKRFLSNFHRVPLAVFEDYLYSFADLSAVEHLFSVTSGIRSMVLGETQIQGQVKQAFEAAQKHKTVGPILSGLFQNALTVGKRTRRETAISEHSLSISHAAVNLVRNSFPDVSTLNILMLGIGKMGLIAAKSLLQYGVRQLTIVNRSQERARELSHEFGVNVVGFEQLEYYLKTADVVISSTGAPHTVLSVEHVTKILREGRNQRLLIVDIAVPRDVDPEVGELEQVNLFNIDQLKVQVESNLECRCSEINKVREIINHEVTQFLTWYQSLEVKPVISELRHRAEEIREQELQRALNRFGPGLSEREAQVVRDLTRRIVNKMLHQPIVCLKEEASEGNGHVYTAAIRHLFGLEKNSN
jgi:glutamyl-tRNA reductase